MPKEIESIAFLGNTLTVTRTDGTQKSYQLEDADFMAVQDILLDQIAMLESEDTVDPLDPSEPLDETE